MKTALALLCLVAMSFGEDLAFDLREPTGEVATAAPLHFDLFSPLSFDLLEPSAISPTPAEEPLPPLSIELDRPTAEEPAADPKREFVRNGRESRLIAFVGVACPPCEEFKSRVVDWLTENPASGWTVSHGLDGSGTIQIVNVANFPEVAEAFGVEQLPAFVGVDEDHCYNATPYVTASPWADRDNLVKLQKGQSLQAIPDAVGVKPITLSSLRSYASRNPSSDWVAVGSIHRHLVDDHGLPLPAVNGLTEQEAISIHGATHTGALWKEFAKP